MLYMDPLYRLYINFSNFCIINIIELYILHIVIDMLLLKKENFYYYLY
jgi:hypothetical protein